jgi:nucleotide-binding universal stress UspA family protein
VVIHVCDEDRIPCFTEQPQHETQAFTEEFLARYAPGVDAQLELRVGVPAPALSTAVRALDADLLAVAWAQVLEHGHAEVVKQLLAESPVPVIFVPR